MIFKLLNLLKNTDKPLTIDYLAEKLNTSEKLVIEMLNHLEKLGYIKKLKINSCSKKCNSCPFAKECKLNFISGWTVNINN